MQYDVVYMVNTRPFDSCNPLTHCPLCNSTSFIVFSLVIKLLEFILTSCVRLTGHSSHFWTHVKHLHIAPIYFFTALHWMQGGLVRRKLSICQTRALWQNGKKISPDFHTVRKNIQPTFLRRRMVGGRRLLLR